MSGNGIKRPVPRCLGICPSGQGLVPPGGLPIAIALEKWAIQRICKKKGFAKD